MNDLKYYLCTGIFHHSEFKKQKNFSQKMTSQRYNLRGVSASKEDVHNAIKNLDKGIFPKAFCKIIPD
ncbi:MAG: hypothetical protein PHD42_00255, partial [Dysgonamonadaceae bacterium]|nr:hypothetical protein [Dysgonamonadaceae bacterium]